MGWADLLGPDNPFAQYVAANRGKLGQIGAGLASGQNFSSGLANAAQNLPQGQATDDAYATQQKAEAERQQAISDAAALKDKYVQFFTQQNQPQYAQAVADGIMEPGAAYGDWMKGQGTEDETSDMQNYHFYANEEMKAGRPPMPFGQWVKGSAAPAAPAGYRATQDGNLSFIPGGPADPSTAGKTTEATRRNQQLAKVIEPEVAALLGDPTKGTPGTFDALANPGNQGWNAVGLGSVATSPEYQQAQNSLKTIIASYLYSVSGATANPGEVENQAAILTPKPGESAQSVADKKARIAVMVQAVQEAATGASMAPQAGGQGGNAGDGWEVIGVQ